MAPVVRTVRDGVRSLDVLLLPVLLVSLAACGRAGLGDSDVTADAGHRSACTPAFVEAGTGRAGNAEIPVYHRAAAACCPATRAPGPATQPYSGSEVHGCATDSDCTSGADGRCFPFSGLVGPGGCSYDECFTDSDCPSGGACLCRSSASDDRANVCVPAGDCLVDSDCGPGGYCSPSTTSCYAQPSYYCHTPADTCINDSDCAPVDAGGGCPIDSTCTYDPQARSWGCTQQRCCPP